MMWKKPSNFIVLVVLLIPCIGLSQEATVSFDGSSADIAGQATTRTPGPWDADDAVWSTTDEVVPALGAQAAFKAAIAQAGTAQRRVGEAHTNGHVFVGGGSKNAEGAAGHAPSPWASIIAFDTTSFDDSFALAEISVTLRKRFATDTLDIRWFVEAGGETYVSDVVAADVGTTYTEVTLADAMTVEWFAFDKNANIEIRAALGSSVGMLALTDVDYVGIHQQLTYTTLQNWHGAYVSQFSANAIPHASTKARQPDPVDGSTEVPWKMVLGWTPGEFAATHDVYLGTAFADVNDADRDNPLDVLLSQAKDVNSYDPGRLAFGQTYYWRVDEVNAAPDNTVFKGNVWSFEVEPHSIPVPGGSITATASSSGNEFSGPEKTVDGSGLDANDMHAIAPDTMWYSAAVDLDPWIQYEFEDVVKLDRMRVWNGNAAAEGVIGWGVKDLEIVTSVDGETWTVLADANELSRAPGLPQYDEFDEIDFGGAAAKYVRFNIQSNWGGVLMSYAISEVQFSMIPVRVRRPEPPSGAVDVLPDVTLAWRAGRDAAMHRVYWDTDVNAVANGSAASVLSATNRLDTASLALELGQTYYWRVDEVNEAAAVPVWHGPVWEFSTVDALVVDDFDSYSNQSPARPFQTWLDGIGYSADEFFPVAYGGNGTGSAIGHDIWSLSSPHYDGDIMETDDTLPGSAKALPFYYANTGNAASETERTFTVPQDWTVGGDRVLAVAFRGQTGNTGTMYVRINDTKVVYDGGSSPLAGIGRSLWQVWHIDLTGISGLQTVTKLALGVEGTGASGMILFDDLFLSPEPTAGPLSNDVTTPGDAILGVPNDDDWPAAESPDRAIDNDVTTKYLHRKGGATPTGIQVTPSVGPTVVTGLALTTANDAPDRDPITFELSGSNAGIEGPYTLIVSGDIIDFSEADAWPRRTRNETPIEFENTVSYTHYQILFPTLRGADMALMQIAEVELLTAE